MQALRDRVAAFDAPACSTPRTPACVLQERPGMRPELLEPWTLHLLISALRSRAPKTTTPPLALGWRHLREEPPSGYSGAPVRILQMLRQRLIGQAPDTVDVDRVLALRDDFLEAVHAASAMHARVVASTAPPGARRLAALAGRLQAKLGALPASHARLLKQRWHRVLTARVLTLSERAAFARFERAENPGGGSEAMGGDAAARSAAADVAPHLLPEVDAVCDLDPAALLREAATQGGGGDRLALGTLALLLGRDDASGEWPLRASWPEGDTALREKSVAQACAELVPDPAPGAFDTPSWWGVGPHMLLVRAESVECALAALVAAEEGLAV